MSVHLHDSASTPVLKRVPEITIERLSIYSRVLSELEREGYDTVSSRMLAVRALHSAAQIRRDFAWFGQFGTRGKGYHIPTLRHQLNQILGVHVRRKVALVGVGNLGSALLGYSGFHEHNFEVVAAFDLNPQKIGSKAQGVSIYSMDDLKAVVQSEGIEIAIVAVPAFAAQDALDALVRAGIQAVLNFAPTQLDAPESVRLRNVDLSVELEYLSYHLERDSV